MVNIKKHTMKTLKLFTKPLLLAMMAGAIISSCSKEAGPKGDAGTQGAQGTTGVKGTDGNTVLSGTAAPAATTGAIGDFYINLATSLFYGPKTNAGWGDGVSLKGAKGATGTAGSKILDGAGAPAATLGATGDYYLDKNSSSFYGPKISTGWGIAVSLKGATGATGSANVMYSGWSFAANFKDSIVDNSAIKVGHLNVPALTTPILNSGTVLLYLNYGGGVIPLPYNSYAGGKANIISFLPKLKQIVITRFTLDNSNTVPLSTIIQYRYIIIPGGTAAPTAAKRPNLANYQEVKAYYNIPD